MEGGCDQIDLGVTRGVSCIQQLGGGAKAKGFLHRPSTVVGGHWNCERQVHVSAREDRRKVSRLAMEWIAVQQHDLEPGKAGVDEQRPQTERVGERQVFVRVAEAAVNLQRHSDLAALFRGCEQQRVA